MIDSIVFDNCIKADDRSDYIIMLDYDDMPDHMVDEDVKNLQGRYGLKMASLYKTEHGFHVVFFYDHLTSWKTCMNVILSSRCDQRYKDVAVKTGKVNTRISVRDGKPDKRFMRHIYADRIPVWNNDICDMIKEGNKIHDMYDRLVNMQINLNKDT